MSKTNSRRAKEGRARRWKGAYGQAHIKAVEWLRSTGINVNQGDTPKVIAAMLGLGPLDSNAAMMAIIRWQSRSGQGVRPITIRKRVPSEVFYKSPEWRAVRYKALRAANGRCVLCGIPGGAGCVLHVDHIKPRSLFPALALDEHNLQVLCEDCNLGKSNTDSIDWRNNTGESDADLEIGRMLAKFC